MTLTATWIAVASATPVFGQLTVAQRDSSCAVVLTSHQLPGRSCQSLAVAAVDVMTRRYYSPLSSRDLQNTSAKPGTAGSAAQAEAVPSVQPEGAGGATVAAVGTDSGTRTMVALTVNPALFFVPPGNAERSATANRIADLTLLLPADNIDADANGRPDYFGVRVRLNVNGARAGRAVTDAGKAFLRAVQKEADRMAEIRKALLETVTDIGACGEALLDPDASAVTTRSACGAEFRGSSDTYQELRRAFDRAHEEADAKYFGVDLRADWGDQTLGSVSDAAASAITAGLAFGRRLGGSNETASVQFRGRAGYRYANLWKTSATSRAFDGGIGLEARRALDESSAVTLSAGIEARYGGDEASEKLLQTNFTMFRATLALPIAGATGVSIAFGTPLAGAIDPTFSVNFNWSVLLPKVGFAPIR